MKMLAIRKRLIKLIRYCTSCEECRDEDIADHLIAEGVVISNLETPTLPKWIPVTERLPEDDQCVLAYRHTLSEEDTFKAKHFGGGWYDMEWNCWRFTVTHWMPLPKPPKTNMKGAQP